MIYNSFCEDEDNGSILKMMKNDNDQWLKSKTTLKKQFNLIRIFESSDFYLAHMWGFSAYSLDNPGISPPPPQTVPQPWAPPLALRQSSGEEGI